MLIFNVEMHKNYIFDKIYKQMFYMKLLSLFSVEHYIFQILTISLILKAHFINYKIIYVEHKNID